MREYLKDEDKRAKHRKYVSNYSKTKQGRIKRKASNKEWLKKHPHYISIYCKAWRKKKRKGNKTK